MMGIRHWFQRTAHKAKVAFKKVGDLGLGLDPPVSEPAKTAGDFADNKGPGQTDDASTDTEHTS